MKSRPLIVSWQMLAWDMKPRSSLFVFLFTSQNTQGVFVRFPALDFGILWSPSWGSNYWYWWDVGQGQLLCPTRFTKQKQKQKTKQKCRLTIAVRKSPVASGRSQLHWFENSEQLLHEQFGKVCFICCWHFYAKWMKESPRKNLKNHAVARGVVVQKI